ncbi:surf-like protein [Tieghemiomyces parasiticus]|uniref:SURF1-like protein n=1 Tax=Tieghemiomyces parasiticus TaxID=78921 RepID=A0A9W8AIP1_9FUNG|nr:surf-like protein [Tieghemiomyces parasiticus]
MHPSSRTFFNRTLGAVAGRFAHAHPAASVRSFASLRSTFRAKVPPPPFPFPSTLALTGSIRTIVTDGTIRRANRGPNLAGRIFLGIIPFICIGLGTWQVYRLRWKEDMIARVDATVAEPVVALPKGITNFDQFTNDWEYRRVLLVGLYHHDQEMLIGPRPNDGENGFMVVTPLEREDGTKVLVKRGWIPKAKADPATRPESRKDELYTVCGLVRHGEEQNMFTPVNHPDRDQWYILNVGEMARHTGSLPLLIDELYNPQTTYPSKILVDRGIPLGRSRDVTFRNNHMQYVVTWYALALATAAMFGVLVYQGRGSSTIRRRIKDMSKL